MEEILHYWGYIDLSSMLLWNFIICLQNQQLNHNNNILFYHLICRFLGVPGRIKPA